eukprot:CAMPEP_0172533562 /NCGR_PEP_ID=MMETSP1067-20121228/6219_1 /TAXON_ID=265564 ORGANISM="Thalassiosira punctigera, Strain Tpunct2005C2" /NCGR_SAMPLE_ID=MMETSP1067 /ASSEMBLY_ACC=CAM_ASM_000444 /LENGTH=413 /DNA_ID=CAMNT_0013318215 /DNA_START=9 /DNA_END=1250 /DNA_ORIENTATION=-
MESLAQSVTAAIESSDYARLSGVFASQWQSLGQGEQRTLASHFIRTAVASPTFFPDAFRSPQIMTVITTTLNHLPPTVEKAADNVLRQRIFEFKLNDEEDNTIDYSTAARMLAGLRMEENDESSAYYMPPVERCDVFVKVAECYLEEDLTVEAEGAVTKAGTIIESTGISMSASGEDGATRDERTVTLLLRYKSTYARVLDANRKFLPAAMKYHDLSTAYLHTDAIVADDLLSMLGRAVTCAILSPNSAQRQRVLGLVYKDERLSQLDAIPEFQSHSAVLTKMYLNRIVQKRELEQFESSLADHQKAIMADGLTIVERGVLEHNMVAVSHLYTSIYFTQLAELLGNVDAVKAERVAAKMISDGSMGGSIDEVEGLLRFHPNKGKEESTLLHWDETITSFCMQLNKVTDAVRAN